MDDGGVDGDSDDEDGGADDAAESRQDVERSEERDKGDQLAPGMVGKLGRLPEWDYKRKRLKNHGIFSWGINRSSSNLWRRVSEGTMRTIETIQISISRLFIVAKEFIRIFYLVLYIHYDTRYFN